jgi:hypothetical protein
MNAVSSTSPAFRPSQQDYLQNEIDAGPQERVKDKEHKSSQAITRSASGATDENGIYFSAAGPEQKITY